MLAPLRWFPATVLNIMRVKQISNDYQELIMLALFEMVACEDQNVVQMK